MSQAASYVESAGHSGDAAVGPATLPAGAAHLESASSHGIDGAKRRYKYHDRGDGMFEAARDLGRQPHLVRTGRCVQCFRLPCGSVPPADRIRNRYSCLCRHAGRSNVQYVGQYDGRWDPHLWVKGVIAWHVP